MVKLTRLDVTLYVHYLSCIYPIYTNTGAAGI